jgi:hypothetical protein
VEFVFRPFFYQKHKRLRRDSITGWASWWAHQDAFNEKDWSTLRLWAGESRVVDHAPAERDQSGQACQSRGCPAIGQHLPLVDAGNPPAIWKLDRAGTPQLDELGHAGGNRPRGWPGALEKRGLWEDGEYLVYEFWTKKFLGMCHRQFTAEKLMPGGVRTYVIRRKLHRPPVVSTSRHISQGGVDLLEVEWEAAAKVVRGRSVAVAYVITLHAPLGFHVRKAMMDGQGTD